MLITFLVMSFIFGLFITYIWSSNGLANLVIKIMFSGYTLFAALVLFTALQPVVAASNMKLF